MTFLQSAVAINYLWRGKLELVIDTEFGSTIAKLLFWG